MRNIKLNKFLKILDNILLFCHKIISRFVNLLKSLSYENFKKSQDSKTNRS